MTASLQFLGGIVLILLILFAFISLGALTSRVKKEDEKSEDSPRKGWSEEVKLQMGNLTVAASYIALVAMIAALLFLHPFGDGVIAKGIKDQWMILIPAAIILATAWGKKGFPRFAFVWATVAMATIVGYSTYTYFASKPTPKRADDAIHLQYGNRSPILPLEKVVHIVLPKDERWTNYGQKPLGATGYKMTFDGTIDVEWCFETGRCTGVRNYAPGIDIELSPCETLPSGAIHNCITKARFRNRLNAEPVNLSIQLLAMD